MEESMIGTWAFRVFALSAAILFVFQVNCRANEKDGTASVKVEELPVYARASLESSIVANVARGRAVMVKVEMLGASADGPWCGIALVGEPGFAGFVQCKGLKRESSQEQEWKLLGVSSASKLSFDATKVIIKGNQVLVPVMLRNGKHKEKALLLLDTGAYQTVIHSEVASRLKLNTRKAEKALVRVADGSAVSTWRIRIDDLRVGPHLLEGMEISIMDFNGPKTDHDGLLGMDVLRSLHYRVDFENQKIVWQ
jgi:predicted aspartyl protease